MKISFRYESEGDLDLRIASRHSFLKNEIRNRIKLKNIIDYTFIYIVTLEIK